MHVLVTALTLLGIEGTIIVVNQATGVEGSREGMYSTNWLRTGTHPIPQIAAIKDYETN